MFAKGFLRVTLLFTSLLKARFPMKQSTGGQEHDHVKRYSTFVCAVRVTKSWGRKLAKQALFHNLYPFLFLEKSTTFISEMLST